MFYQSDHKTRLTRACRSRDQNRYRHGQSWVHDGKRINEKSLLGEVIYPLTTLESPSSDHLTVFFVVDVVFAKEDLFAFV